MNTILKNDSRGLKKEVENYVDQRVPAHTFPIDPLVIAQSCFNVHRIECGVKMKGSIAKLSRSESGFTVYTSLRADQQRDLRFVVAHELTHLMFVNMDRRGGSVNARQEEALCNYGARAILMPKNALMSVLGEEINLPKIIRAATRFDVHPHWLAARLFVDLEWGRASFFCFRGEADSLRRDQNADAIAPMCEWTRDELRQIRRIASTRLQNNGPALRTEQLGVGIGRFVTVEFVDEQADHPTLFPIGTKVYVLVRQQ